MERYYIVFKGRVQGVGFRYTAAMLAERYQLTGWIRNMNNGNVELEIQGPHESLFKFIEQLTEKKNWILVNDYSMKEIDSIEETQFKIVY